MRTAKPWVALVIALAIIISLPELVRRTDVTLGRTPSKTEAALADLNRRMDQADVTLTRMVAERTEELAHLRSVEDLVPVDLRTAVVHAAVYNGLDPRLLAAVGWVETGGTWDPRLRGLAGETGLMQIMPATATWIAQQRKLPVPDLTDPAVNLDWGAWYLAHLLEQTGGDQVEALRRYNAGPRWRDRAPTAARGYSDRVQRVAAQPR